MNIKLVFKKENFDIVETKNVFIDDCYNYITLDSDMIHVWSEKPDYHIGGFYADPFFDIKHVASINGNHSPIEPWKCVFDLKKSRGVVVFWVKENN